MNREEAIERIIRQMDSRDDSDDRDALREVDSLRDDSDGGLDDVEGLIDFDRKVREAVPTMSRELESALDGAVRKAALVARPASARHTRIVVWAFAAAAAIAAMVLLAVRVYPPRGAVPLDLDVAMVDTTRSGGGVGDAVSYRIQIESIEAAYWFVIELDENDAVRLIFPYRDLESGQWDLLGHEDNLAAAGVPVVIPRPDAMGALVAEGSPGAVEFVFVVARREPLSLDDFLLLGSDLEKVVGESRSEGRSTARIVDALEQRLGSRFDAVQTLTRTYE